MPNAYAFDPLAGLVTRFTGQATHADPVAWAKDVMKIETYSKQRQILRTLEIVPKLAVPSCHDAGKSFIAALACVRFLSRFPPGTARVVSTAPTMTQVRAILWNEINAMYAKVPDLVPGSRINQTEWWIGGYMAGIGRKPSDYAPETFSGLHAENMLIVIDEAGDVPNDIWTGVDTLATNEGAVILAIGNPNDAHSEFKDVCAGAPDNGWTVIKIPAWETPNLSGEICAPIFKRVLVTKIWVDDKKIKWGEDSAIYKSKVAAEFPDEGSMTVVRVSDVSYAQISGADEDHNFKSMTGASRFVHIQLGVDIAASDTGDVTVCRERVGNKIGRRWAVQSGEPEDVADLIVLAVEESGASLAHVDTTGVGFGFLSELRKRCPGTAFIPFIAQEGATDRKQFVNRRAEGHWFLRERLRKHELDLSEMEEDNEDDQKTVKEMVSIKYKLVKGRIQIEEKKEVRSRIDRSPDDMDALILSILPPIGSGAPSRATASTQSKNRVNKEKQAALQRRMDMQGAIAEAGINTRRPRAVPERVIPASGGRLVVPGRRRRTIRARTE